MPGEALDYQRLFGALRAPSRYASSQRAQEPNLSPHTG
jgi:hypothetical protein